MGTVFQFRSSTFLEILTGREAWSLADLINLIETCSESAIFYHTFSAFLRLREAQVRHNTDFAIWVSKGLHEKALAEKLMVIDLSEYSTLETLRSRFLEIIRSYTEEHPYCLEKIGDEPFFLSDVMRIVYLTDKFAYDLQSFRDLLATVSIHSIYYHFIESRLYTSLQTNDFSRWIEEGLEIPELARKIRNIDIHVFTLEGLRSRIMGLLDEFIGAQR